MEGGALKTEGNLVKLLPEHLHSETTGISGLSGDLRSHWKGLAGLVGLVKGLVGGAGTRTPRPSLSHTSIRLSPVWKLGSPFDFRPPLFCGIGDLDPSPRSDQISRLSQGCQCAPLTPVLPSVG